MNEATTPRRIEWVGPERWIVWADEDGVHLRAPHGDGLEMPDVERLFSLWTNARADVGSGSVPAPKPPTKEELGAMTSAHAAEYALRRATRALEAEFNPPTDAPF